MTSKNLEEAIKLFIPDSNTIHSIVNGASDEMVPLPEGGKAPTVRKAFADSLLFKNPTPWNSGSTEIDPLQLRTFTDGLIYWAPTAQLTNPVAMGASPSGDSNWKIAPLAVNNEGLIRVFDTVVDMKAATWLQAGQLVERKGYYTAGDGGSGKMLLIDSTEYIGIPDGCIDFYIHNGLVAKLVVSDRLNLKQCGAATGIDSTDAVRCAVFSGYPLQWGYSEDTYTITSPIIGEPVVIDWKNEGATIKALFPMPQPRAIYLKGNLITNVIKGFSIDCNNLAFVGLEVYSDDSMVDTSNAPHSYPDILVEDFKAKNAYRASNDYNLSADGLVIRGAWKKVIINRPTVKNSKVAIGATVIGSYGAFGLSVLRGASDSKISPYFISVTDPYIDRVYSEDPDMVHDQDGMRLYTSYAQGSDYVQGSPNEMDCIVKGGIIRDCRNRSIKLQTSNAKVTGLSLVRTGEVAGNTTRGSSGDINQQTGGLLASDVTFHYRGHAPQDVIAVRTVQDIPNTNSVKVSGINGMLSEGANLWSILATGSQGETKTRASLSNVEVEVAGSGSLRRVAYIVLNSGEKGFKDYVDMKGCYAPVTDQWVRLEGSNKPINIDMYACHNTGDSNKPILTDTVGGPSRLLNALACTGFLPRRFEETGQSGAFTRIEAIAASSDTRSGLIRPVGFTLADGEIGVIPVTSATGSVGGNILLIACSHNVSGAQGVFTLGASTFTEVSGSSLWQSGGGQEPITGTYRIWNEPDGTKVRNMSGAERQFTAMILG